ncbi:hypothetical protein [Nitriliruptor alkaliphilus]|uniref:hypothetical protein n=1 Tax=Nitriliruptor alkaliphilus TaxID=427918 RepID=UPI000697FF35|nr:hypothetical protein [Nitriliruptor alkaliphilus]
MMLADPDRHRRLIACTLIFIIAFMVRAERRGWFDRYDPESVSAIAADDRVIAAVPEPPASPPKLEADSAAQRPEEPSAASLDRAHDVAEDFATQYLTWPTGEPHSERVARVASHTTPELARDIAEARPQGAADEANRDEGWLQTVEILGTQTLTVRARHVEVTVLTEVTTIGDDASTVTPTNLTVALREEGGAWLVDGLR